MVPDPADRPYAGWADLELPFIRKTPRTLSLQVGIVGPSSLAGRTQSAIHDWIGSPRVRGWDSGLGDEPGVNLIYERWCRL